MFAEFFLQLCMKRRKFSLKSSYIEFIGLGLGVIQFHIWVYACCFSEVLNNVLPVMT